MSTKIPSSLSLGESPEAVALMNQLTGSPVLRRALLALAAKESLQLGLLKIGLHCWPQDLPRNLEEDQGP
jgi:hypothetical protein